MLTIDPIPIILIAALLVIVIIYYRIFNAIRKDIKEDMQKILKRLEKTQKQ